MSHLKQLSILDSLAFPKSSEPGCLKVRIYSPIEKSTFLAYCHNPLHSVRGIYACTSTLNKIIIQHSLPSYRYPSLETYRHTYQHIPGYLSKDVKACASTSKIASTGIRLRPKSIKARNHIFLNEINQRRFSCLAAESRDLPSLEISSFLMASPSDVIEYNLPLKHPLDANRDQEGEEAESEESVIDYGSEIADSPEPETTVEYPIEPPAFLRTVQQKIWNFHRSRKSIMARWSLVIPSSAHQKSKDLRASTTS